MTACHQLSGSYRCNKKMGHDDETVRVWDAATGELLQTREDHGGSVRSPTFSPDYFCYIIAGVKKGYGTLLISKALINARLLQLKMTVTALYLTSGHRASSACHHRFCAFVLSLISARLACAGDMDVYIPLAKLRRRRDIPAAGKRRLRQDAITSAAKVCAAGIVTSFKCSFSQLRVPQLPTWGRYSHLFRLRLTTSRRTFLVPPSALERWIAFFHRQPSLPFSACHHLPSSRVCAAP